MKKHLLLLGAGHAHAVLLRTWAAQGFKPRDCCLISESPLQMYSGMVPGWLAGDYSAQDCQLDVAALCQRLGVEWIAGSVSAIAADARWVEAAGRRFEFDFLSINLGGRQQVQPGGQNSVAIKPFPAFVAQVHQLDTLLTQRARVLPLKLAVVGGGLGGFELVLGLVARYQTAGPQLSISWFTGPQGPLPKLTAGARSRALQALKGKPVALQQQYFAADAQGDFAGVVWACQGQAADFLRASGLTLDGAGFIAVDEYFQSLSHGGIFAAGDVCRRLDGTLAPSGVNAVRAGSVLAANLKQRCYGAGHVRGYIPTPWVLQIAALGQHTALAIFGPWYWQAPWVWRLKRFIDRRFMQSFQSPPNTCCGL
ncbi:MAG TPA: FAD-dependent oxidoreductase [Cellvibrionaceae bacterium]|nr:FAD-dependent oxidoreductase [Cellvibrionaceae bacterium]